MRLGGPAHGIVTKTVHKTLSGGGGFQGVGGYVKLIDRKVLSLIHPVMNYLLFFCHSCLTYEYLSIIS